MLEYLDLFRLAKSFKKNFRDELDVIRLAPFSFLISVIILGIIEYFIIDTYCSYRIKNIEDNSNISINYEKQRLNMCLQNLDSSCPTQSESVKFHLDYLQIRETHQLAIIRHLRHFAPDFPSIPVQVVHYESLETDIFTQSLIDSLKLSLWDVFDIKKPASVDMPTGITVQWNTDYDTKISKAAMGLVDILKRIGLDVKSMPTNDFKASNTIIITIGTMN